MVSHNSRDGERVFHRSNVYAEMVRIASYNRKSGSFSEHVYLKIVITRRIQKRHPHLAGWYADLCIARRSATKSRNRDEKKSFVRKFTVKG